MLELSDDVVGEDPQRRMLKPVRLSSDDEDEEDEDEQEPSLLTSNLKANICI